MKKISETARLCTIWLVQQLGIPVTAFIFTALASGVPWALSSGNRPSAILEDGWRVLMAVASGFLFSFFPTRAFPAVAKTGGFIWIPPVSFLTWVVGYGLYQGSPLVMRQFFFPDNKSGELLPFVILTTPTIACVAYSIGVTTFRPSEARHGQSGGSVPSS